MCSKVKYASEKLAKEAMNILHRKSRRIKKQIQKRVYYCDECHWYHLSSKKVLTHKNKKWKILD